MFDAISHGSFTPRAGKTSGNRSLGRASIVVVIAVSVIVVRWLVCWWCAVFVVDRAEQQQLHMTWPATSAEHFPSTRAWYICMHFMGTIASAQNTEFNSAIADDMHICTVCAHRRCVYVHYVYLSIIYILWFIDHTQHTHIHLLKWLTQPNMVFNDVTWARRSGRTSRKPEEEEEEEQETTTIIKTMMCPVHHVLGKARARSIFRGAHKSTKEILHIFECAYYYIYERATTKP